jgi:hypothetical protein
LVDLTLIVVPDPSALSREHGLEAQQVFHLARLEDAALWVGQRNAVTTDSKPNARSAESTTPKWCPSLLARVDGDPSKS